MRALTEIAEMTTDRDEWTNPPSRFGEALQALHVGVESLAERLTPLLYEDDANQLNQILSALRGKRCRVAVLGQVKAGKSSLVNALVRRRNLCPTNINPWTAVVCHLNFGGRINPMARAVFTFFDEEDWSYFGSGGRMRELSDKLGISVDQEDLLAHLDNTRKRAEHRLGRQFQHLLGQQHQFAEPSDELLARYVSVGADEDDDDDDRRQPQAGRFSDITKSAELSFDQEPFAYPTTIIDTPGTNDPLLVRDDLTQHAVEGADVHIVVLTAEQALSTADISMLRMLHGLHKERLVVFINRIDALSDITNNVPRVVGHVRDQLAIEFSETNIPVVAGSALWAEHALACDSSDGLPRAFHDWARELGLPLFRTENAPASGEDDQPETTDANTVMAAAGIKALEDVLGKVMYDGPTMLALMRALANIRSLHDDVHSRLQNECTTLDQALELATIGQAQAEDERQEFEHLDLLRSRLEEIRQPFEQDLSILKNANAKRMRAALDQVVMQFAEEQTESLCAAHRVSRIGRVWRCDTRPLRRQLEQIFLTSYDIGAGELLDVEGEAWQRMEDVLNEFLADQKVKFKGRPPHSVDPSPSISGLGTTVALDLGSQWERWWHRWQTMTRRARRFKELVHSEFSPIVAVLLMTAQSEFSQQCEISMQHFEETEQQILKFLEQRRDRLEQLRGSLASSDQSEAAAIFDGYKSQRQAVLAELARSESIAADIQELTRRYEEELNEAEMTEPCCQRNWA